MPTHDIRYFVLDVESVADGALVAALRYPGAGLGPAEAVARYRAELLETRQTDSIPYTYQVPVSIAVAKVTAAYALADLVILDEPAFRPHVIADLFWRGWEAYGQPTLVTYNGRGFDLPLLELAAFRYGLALPRWFGAGPKGSQARRNRYNAASHLDLMELLTNFGAARFSGGLDLAARLLGKPGKMEVEGQLVQGLHEEGRLGESNDYCRCDVLDTYFVFLRTRVLVGQLTLEREQDLVAATKRWLEERAAEHPAYQAYLAHWGDWPNPWKRAEPAAASV